MKNKRCLRALSLLILISTLLCSCNFTKAPDDITTLKTITSSEPTTTTTTVTTDGSPQTTTPNVTTAPVTEPPAPEPTIISLLAVGDNLIHTPLVTCGQKAGYDTLYKELAPMIAEADIAIINQETIFTDQTPSGYPAFGSPKEIGEAALAAGFDVFSTATNHTADKGEDAILYTLDFWDEHPEGLVLGLNREKSNRTSVPSITVKGVKIGFLNYTYGMNKSLKKWWMVDILDKTDDGKALIAERIEKAKEECDFVVMCAHWGAEYVNTPTATEQMWAQFFADCGVDLVIGTHPHVVQPVMELEGKDGNKTVVYYSLGNFVHNQNDFAPNIGGLANITLISDEDGVRIKDYELVGTMVDCYRNESGVRCYTACLISEMTEERLKKHLKFSNLSVADFENEFLKASTSYPKG